MTDDEGLNISVTLDVRVPMTPNFLCVGGQLGVGGRRVSIADFTDAQLGRLGKAWADALIASAQEKRKKARASA